MASVDICGVVKRYGGTLIIQGIDLAIHDREFVVLVGPSGCGKSTLLRMIAGLEEVTEGDILLDGRRINNEPPMSRDVAMVFQTYALYPHMTVEQNMGFSLRMKKMPKPEIREKVARAAAILNLEPYLDRYPRQLSGGQRQRVAMGRAIVRHPKAFLFDEPLSNLDAKLRVQMRTEIKTLHRTLESTSVYVTHDQVEAMTMGDKIVIMNKGIIEQIGSPLEVYDHPRNQFVAGFIGSPAMNFIPGTVEDGMFRAPGGGTLSVSGQAVHPGPVVLGIRPEHLDLADADATDTLRGAVVSVEPTGSETHVVCDLGGVRIMFCTSSRPNLSIGEGISLAAKKSRLHYFDSKSGQALSHGPAAGAAS